jgi:hypothetical protein
LKGGEEKSPYVPDNTIPGRKVLDGCPTIPLPLSDSSGWSRSGDFMLSALEKLKNIRLIQQFAPDSKKASKTYG